MHIHTLRPPGSPSLVTTILKWVCGGGWGWRGLIFFGGDRGLGAIAFQEAAS